MILMDLFKKKEFNEMQLALLKEAAQIGIDTKPLKNPDFKIKQMRCLILAAKEGIDIHAFAEPSIDYYTMLLIVNCIQNGYDYTPLLKHLNQVRASAIYYNLSQGLKVNGNESDEELFNQFEIATGISRNECQVPIFIQWSQGLYEILINSQIILYKDKFINEGLSEKEAEDEAIRKVRS